MNTKLYVGNLPMSITESGVRDLFAKHGAVSEVHLRLDRGRSEPLRFAFVTMATTDGASAAIFGLNGREMDGRELRVNQSRTEEGGAPVAGSEAVFGTRRSSESRSSHSSHDSRSSYSGSGYGRRR